MVSVSDELICTRRSQRSAKQGTHTDIQAVKEYCRQGCLLNDDWLELNTVQNYTSVTIHTLPYPTIQLGAVRLGAEGPRFHPTPDRKALLV